MEGKFQNLHWNHLRLSTVDHTRILSIYFIVGHLKEKYWIIHLNLIGPVAFRWRELFALILHSARPENYFHLFQGRIQRWPYRQVGLFIYFWPIATFAIATSKCWIINRKTPKRMLLFQYWPRGESDSGILRSVMSRQLTTTPHWNKIKLKTRKNARDVLKCNNFH
jgi:hypothetical protein